MRRLDGSGSYGKYGGLIFVSLPLEYHNGVRRRQVVPHKDSPSGEAVLEPPLKKGIYHSLKLLIASKSFKPRYDARDHENRLFPSI